MGEKGKGGRPAGQRREITRRERAFVQCFVRTSNK
nr:MAG TPA: hypothetical protein [Caudoviricetes sp.]